MGWGLYPESIKYASFEEVALSMYFQGLLILGIAHLAKFAFPWLPI